MMYMHFYMQTCIFLPAPSSGDIFRDFGYRVSSAQTASGRHVGHFLIYIFFIIVLVDALEHFCLYSWEFHHPTDSFIIFQRGGEKPTTNQKGDHPIALRSRWKRCITTLIESMRMDPTSRLAELNSGDGGEHIFMACEKCVCNHISHAIRCFFWDNVDFCMGIRVSRHDENLSGDQSATRCWFHLVPIQLCSEMLELCLGPG